MHPASRTFPRNRTGHRVDLTRHGTTQGGSPTDRGSLGVTGMRASRSRWAVSIPLAWMLLLTGCGAGSGPRTAANGSSTSPSASSKAAAKALHGVPFAIVQLQMSGASSAFALAAGSHPIGTAWEIFPFDTHAPLVKLFVLHTTDGGTRWVNITPKDPFGGMTTVYDSTIFFRNGEDGWLAVAVPHGTGAAVYVARTVNAGKSWAIARFDTPVAGSVAMDFVNANDGWILATSTPAAGLMNKAIYATSDGGRSWRESSCTLGPGCPQGTGGLPADSYPTGLSILGTDVFVTALNHGDPYVWFYRSPDSGRSWTRIPLDAPEAFQGAYGDAYPPAFTGRDGSMFVVYHTTAGSTVAAVYHSVNAGRTWGFVNGSAIRLAGPLPAAVGWETAEQGYVASVSGRTLHLTNDGGQTWTVSKLPAPLPVASVASTASFVSFSGAEDGMIVAVGRKEGNVLLATRDGGRTWTPIDPVVSSRR